jgi:hypothetical protein
VGEEQLRASSFFAEGGGAGDSSPQLDTPPSAPHGEDKAFSFTLSTPTSSDGFAPVSKPPHRVYDLGFGEELECCPSDTRLDENGFQLDASGKIADTLPNRVLMMSIFPPACVHTAFWADMTPEMQDFFDTQIRMGGY